MDQYLRTIRFFRTLGLGFALIFLAAGFKARPAFGLETVALKQYQQLAIPVPNPMNISSLPHGKTYQVTHPHFILQFFFNGKDVMGFIFKRNKNFPIYLRWCFFKSCEPSSYDYKSAIAENYSPPFDQNFFEVTFPPQIQYQFQGLEFSSWN